MNTPADTSSPSLLTFNWSALRTRFPAVAPQAHLTRELPTDFCVTEIPAYPPSGSGEHVMVRLEKRGISTLEAVRRLCTHFKVDARQAGFAGRKDVHAVASQWVTIPKGRAQKVTPGAVDPQLTVLEAAVHKNKLKLGHLRGNRFDIVLRQPVAGALETLQARLSNILTGVPNYFGPQRFGVGGSNARDGLAVLQGARRGGDFRGLQLLISALQSFIFNQVASLRLEQDPNVLPVEGDILIKVPTGAPFWCDAPHTDAQRVLEGTVAVTGPLPGSKMRQPLHNPLTWESRILKSVLPDPTQLTQGSRAPVGDRRAILVRPQNVEVIPVPQGLRVSMTLPAGSFATSVLREWAGITAEGGAPDQREDASG